MNVIAGIILAALLVHFGVQTLADFLNLRNLSERLPEEFETVYDQERYRKSQEYLRVNTRLGQIVAAFNLAVILLFWFGGGFPLLDGWVRSVTSGPVVSGLLYIGLLMLFRGILALPFNIYETFVIEERFGFNQTTWRVFLLDLVKGTGLGILLGGPLLAGILAFFQYAGSNAWWYCWIVLTLFTLVVSFVAPTWIMPLFNRFTPLEQGALRSAIMAYAKSIDFPLKNIYVMDGSKRSSKSNAFFTGFGRHKRIVLFDTLVARHTISELIAVLAHEMGHYKKKHILWSLLLGILQTGFMLYLLSLFISYEGLFEAFYMDQVSVYGGLIFFGMLYSPISVLFGVIMQAFSRRNEYAADRFAVETAPAPFSLVQALKKLSVHNLSNLQPHPLYVFLNYSHPPVLERIRAIKTRIASQFPQLVKV